MNWADPDSTTAEQTMGATIPQPSWRARTPNDTPSTIVATANGSPALAPAPYPRSAGVPSSEAAEAMVRSPLVVGVRS